MRWTRRAAATIRIAAQILGLWIILQAGESLAARSPFPIPGNVLGMTLLFLLLMLGLAKESWLSAGAGLLTRHLAFFFVPIAVGLMQWSALFADVGHWLLLALGLSALATLVVTGAVVQWLSHISEERSRWDTRPSSPSPLRSPSPSTPSVAEPS
jgi:holin-like protein